MPSNVVASRPRVPLRALDRTMTISDTQWFMIAHLMHLQGCTNDLVRHVPVALLKTFNKHPRMRVKMLKEEFAMVEIYPRLESPEELTAQKLLHIKDVTADELSLEASRAFVEQVGHTPSGCTILHDVLAFASALSREEPSENQELVIREPLYNAFLGDHPLLSPLLRATLKLTGRTLLSLASPPAHVLPPNNLQENFRQHPLPQNPSSTLLATGTPENLTKIISKCRAEGTTFTGALAAAVYLNYILATDSMENKAFKLKWIVPANMRQRVGTPYAKDDVGSFSATSNVYVPPMDVPSQTFWNLARTLRKHMVDAVENAPALAMALILTDQHVHRDADLSSVEKTPFTAGTDNDLDISSLGRYEYPHTHSFRSGELTINSLHYVGRLPFLTALCQIYVTSLDRVGYAMTHQYDETTGTSLFENTVKIMEACWKIESNVRLVDVATKLTA